jgi:hypothetical protein
MPGLRCARYATHGSLATSNCPRKPQTPRCAAPSRTCRWPRCWTRERTNPQSNRGACAPRSHRRHLREQWRRRVSLSPAVWGAGEEHSARKVGTQRNAHFVRHLLQQLHELARELLSAKLGRHLHHTQHHTHRSLYHDAIPNHMHPSGRGASAVAVRSVGFSLHSRGAYRHRGNVAVPVFPEALCLPHDCRDTAATRYRQWGWSGRITAVDPQVGRGRTVAHAVATWSLCKQVVLRPVGEVLQVETHVVLRRRPPYVCVSPLPSSGLGPDRFEGRAQQHTCLRWIAAWRGSGFGNAPSL